jgi:1,2-phenylacetyl-CoA epoxidase PaaB subunit
MVSAKERKPRDVIQPRWGVYRLAGKRAERLAFTVTARDAEQAIERAIKEYDVPERERFRVSVQREA